ncbi:MAG TPA: hypothetical protein VN904_03635 [Chthoniobacterales bacterium]|nr:hypothetical protein [Chthoniobacterales bacterium]
MATPPERFRTHDRGRTGSARKIDEASDAFVKIFRLHVIGVTAKSLITPGGVF